MRFGGIVLAALLTLGACTGSDPEPKEPSPSTSSPRPTATAPTMPAQAKQDSPEGAAAFVKHYIDVFNYASNTGDVTELSRLSAPSCEGCQRYISLYKETYDSGGYFRGGEWRPGKIELEFGGDEQFATTIVAVAPSRFKRHRSDNLRDSKGVDTKISFGIVKQKESWAVNQLGLGEIE